MTIETRFLRENEYEAWNAFVFQSPDGSPYANTLYLETLCEAAGGRFRVLVAEKAGEITAGCALYEIPSRWGITVGPRLLLQYNGIVTRTARSKYPSEATAQHVQAISALEAAITLERFASVTLKSRATLGDVRPLVARGWMARPTYTYVVPLTDLAAQWQLVEGNLRRLVGRAERDGLRLTDDEDFDSLYRFHHEIHIRKGAPLYLPERPFRRFVERLRRLGLCRLYHARMPDGSAAASQLVLTGAHPVSHTACAGAAASKQSSGANPFLRWKAFEALAAIGSVANDLTDASLNPVTHFKSQFGGRLEVAFALLATDTRAYRWGTMLENMARGALRKLGLRQD